MPSLKIKKSKKSQKNQSNEINVKDKLAQKKQAREAKKKLINVITFSVFCFILFGLPTMLIAGVKYGLMVGGGIPILILSYIYPRQALWLFLIYLPFGGTITYSIGQGSPLFQLAKDVFYIPALVSLIQEQVRKRRPILIPKQIMPTLGILLVFCFLTLFAVNGLKEFLPVCDAANPILMSDPQTGILIEAPCKDGQPFFQGLFGLKVLLGYFPLIFCAYYLIEDKKKLIFLGRMLVVIAIICCVLALVQYWMLKSGRCVGTRNAIGVDIYKSSLDARCFVGGSLLYSPEFGQIRLPGTFVSPWHWAWFLVANAAISYTVAFSEMLNAIGETINKTSLFWGITGLVSMVLVLINAIVCGQRLAFLLVPLIIVILLIITFFLLSTSGGANIKELMAKLKKLIPILLGVVIFVIVGGGVALSFFNPDFIQERYDSFVSRWNQSNPTEFTSAQVGYALHETEFLGRGLGSATSSARFLGEIAFIETYHSKVIYEMGFLGFLAFMVFLTHLLILTFKAYRSVADPGLSSYGSSLWVFMVIISYLPYWYPLDTDPVAVYYWFFAGVILKLPQIYKQEQKELQASQENSNSPRKKFQLKKKKLTLA